MRLVIEREGGFDVIPESDHVKRIDVQNYGVKVSFLDDTGGEWSEVYPVADHAAACRLSAAIAVRCGVLVEPLAEQEEPEADGLEDAAADDAMGAVMAGLVRQNTTSRRVTTAGEWVAGEPPKDGRWYVVALHREGNGYGMPPSLAAWYGGRWVRCDAEPETAVAWHLPTPVPGVPS